MGHVPRQCPNPPFRTTAIGGAEGALRVMWKYSVKFSVSLRVNHDSLPADINWVVTAVLKSFTYLRIRTHGYFGTVSVNWLKSIKISARVRSSKKQLELLLINIPTFAGACPFRRYGYRY
jgi:hypothetical protein